MSEYSKLTIEADDNKSDSTIGLLNDFVGANPAPAGYGNGAGRLPSLPKRYDKDSNLADLADTEGYGGYVRLEQQLSFADFVATAAAHNEKIAYHNDIDKSPLNYFQFQEDGVKDNQYSAETQLLSKKDSVISWTTGAFFLKQDFGFPIPAKIYGDSFGPGVTVLVGDSGKTTSYALYGQTSFDILSRLRATLGGRYNRDEVIGRGLTNLDITGVGFIAGVPQTNEAVYDKFTWRGALDFKVTDDVLVYGSVSTGTKAGVFNLVTFNPTPVQPEELKAYEVGVKSEFLDRRLRVNAAAFFYDYKDLQVQTQQPDGVTNLSNAKAAHIKGAEVESELAPVDNLTLRASVTYLDAKYTDYGNAPFYQPNPNPPYGLFASTVGDATGNRLSRAPQLSGTAGVEYRVPVQNDEMTLGLNYSYTGAFFWNPDNLVRQPGYGLLDANVAYNFTSRRVTLMLWGSNLTNAVYNLTENEFGGPIGTSSGPGAPRTYGIRARYKFK